MSLDNESKVAEALAKLRTSFFLFAAFSLVLVVSDLLVPGAGDRVVAAAAALLAGLVGFVWLLGVLGQRRRSARQSHVDIRPEQHEADDEHSYVNALLTTMANGPATSVVLTLGTGVPPLRPLVDDPKELQWIDSFPFRYEELDATKVVSLILTLAGYRFYHFFRLHYELNALLVLEDGKTVPCRFRVDRISRHPAGPIRISKVS